MPFIDPFFLRVYLNVRESPMQLYRVPGLFEDKVLDFLKQNLKPDSTVFDIGGNQGDMGLRMFFYMKRRGHVYIFEPMPNNTKWIRKSILLNRCENNIHLCETALSDYSGSADMYIGKHSGWSSFKDNLPSVTDENLNVNVTTIDEFFSLNSIKKVDLLKIDTEGHEINVLKGALNTLSRYSPKLILESHSDYITLNEYMSVLQLLKSIGYRVFHLENGMREIENGDFIVPNDEHLVGIKENN